QGLTSVSQSDLSLITYQGKPALTKITNGNITSDLYTSGGDITIAANTINLHGHTIDSARSSATASPVPIAGNINLVGQNITIDGDAKLLAKASAGGTDGDINILGTDVTQSTFGVGYYNAHYRKTTITIGQATIHGANVTIGATATTQRFDTPNTNGDAELALIDTASHGSDWQSIIEAIKGLAVVVAVSKSTSIATIDIGSGAEIEAANFVATANADARVTPTPFALLGLAVSVG